MARNMFFRNARTKAKNFFGQVTGNIHKGMNFLNNHIIPGAQKGLTFVQNASKNLQNSDHLGEKAKRRLLDVESLAQAGFKNLSAGADLAQRVHSAM